ncbi:MAG TPA: hypothetical protein VEJ20_07380, partial [Candidatus Eremiobacteraceae bacterium]|nr:hypothetical protein [Candidatus Eremiobacteraceae bacterium]
MTLTVYGDFATIYDVREVDLQRGTGRIAFEDISPQIDPKTAIFTNVSGMHPVWVDDQFYDANRLTAAAVQAAALGHTVLVITTNPKTGQEIGRQTATLLSQDGPILQMHDRVEVGLPPDSRIAYLSVPSGFRRTPALVADVGASEAAPTLIGLSYVSDGFGWSADYVCTLDAASTSMDMEALATISNGTQADFENARLQFVSGSVQRISQPVFRPR